MVPSEILVPSSSSSSSFAPDDSSLLAAAMPATELPFVNKHAAALEGLGAKKSCRSLSASPPPAGVRARARATWMQESLAAMGAGPVAPPSSSSSFPSPASLKPSTTNTSANYVPAFPNTRAPPSSYGSSGFSTFSSARSQKNLGLAYNAVADLVEFSQQLQMQGGMGAWRTHTLLLDTVSRRSHVLPSFFSILSLTLSLCSRIRLFSAWSFGAERKGRRGRTLSPERSPGHITWSPILPAPDLGDTETTCPHLFHLIRRRNVGTARNTSVPGFLASCSGRTRTQCVLSLCWEGSTSRLDADARYHQFYAC